jgi:hypothetical protein
VKRILNPERVPPGGNYRYVVPESGMEFLGQTPGVVLVKVRAHCVANNFPLRHLEQRITDQFCERHPELCEEVDEATGQPTLAELAKRFAVAMKSWASSGFKIVTSEQFAERRDICMTCNYWQGDGANVGTGRCGKCGCSGLKLFAASERCPEDPPKWDRLTG